MEVLAVTRPIDIDVNEDVFGKQTDVSFVDARTHIRRSYGCSTLLVSGDQEACYIA